VADIAAGMYAYSGVLTGLLRRANTGAGSAFEVSLFEALAEWMSQPAYYTRYGGAPPPRAGAEHATIAPYGPYTTADGDTVVLAVQNQREWVALCRRVLGDEDAAHDERFATNPARVRNRAALNAVLAKRFAELSTAETLDLLGAAGVANGRMNTMPDFLAHPVLAQRGRWRSVGSPGGEIDVLAPPVTFAGVEPNLGPVPATGAHTDAILAELGRTDDQIADLRADRTV
jgi:formyl-CoA transferase